MATMTLRQTLALRAKAAGRLAQIALIAETGDRVQPVYQEYMIGTHSDAIARSVEIGWSYACGGVVDDSEVRALITELDDVIEFYGDEGIDVLQSTVMVTLRILQALSPNEDESNRAVGRGLVSARDVAQYAEAMTQQRIPKNSRLESASREEEAWQDAALRLIDGWQNVANGAMFEPLGNNPPAWLADWRARTSSR